MIVKLLPSHVNTRIDPILIATVCIMHGSESRRKGRLELFLAKLTNGKPAEYYAQHVKNLAIFSRFHRNKEINPILAICTGVESLLLLGQDDLNFFENPQVGRSLRRLSVRLGNFPRQIGWTHPTFHHSCFAKLTHLHLWDDYWSIYTGWENLISLTHLAFAYPDSPESIRIMQMLPTVRYVALGFYGDGGEEDKYADITVNNHYPIPPEWGGRAVYLSTIPQHDWERGARGEGDFWDLVEREVERRLREERLID